MDVWQRAVDNERFNPAFRSDEWRSRITDGHPDRVVLTYVGRLGAGESHSLTVSPAEPAPKSLCMFALWVAGVTSVIIRAHGKLCAAPAMWEARLLRDRTTAAVSKSSSCQLVASVATAR